MERVARNPGCSFPHSAALHAGYGRWTPDAPGVTTRAMKKFLLLLFTWWNGQTFGTLVWTWLYGEFVGEDEFGNRYYRTKGGKIDPRLHFERRWVIYSDYAAASTVPPGWHGWMHHIVDVPPTQGAAKTWP